MNAKHHKAAEYSRDGFFRGIKSFDQLEEKISALPDKKAEGDAFEVFAEAYLATQRRDAQDIWPLNAAPPSLLSRVSLRNQDYGIDGLFQTHLGQLNAYQVKFRSNRHPLTWRELSTFMGLADSPEIYQRVLIANSNDLPPVINDRTGFYCIRGSDFDRLKEADFETIANWLQGLTVTHKKKDPLPHQKEALDSLLPSLKEEDRVTAIMACGTGKTLLALWIAEQPEYKKLLVLVPSLALIRQTLHEWLRETRWEKLAYVCVCSDPSVKAGLDFIETPQSDIDFPVSTDPENVREFLEKDFDGVKLVFSTYQSAKVVSQALQEGESFDLGIFDEAHKTAGREGRNSSWALEDKNLPIKKRLFLTATPRKYNPLKKSKEGDNTLVYSMDNPKVYGPHSFILNFGEAACRRIICHYKIIVSRITSDIVDNELLHRGEVLVKGDAVHARTVANQIAMKDVIENYGPKKAFTFHKTVSSAKAFTGSGPGSISNHLEEFKTFHINGRMNTAERESVMKEFKGSQKAIISNARCLTEGVDVPAVDMVAFLSPRKSRVDVVQATGRAMRKDPDNREKTCGYILVPIYVEQEAGETIEAAVARAKYDEVWDVLQSMLEQDETLYDIIQQMAINKGRGVGDSDLRANLAEKIEFVGPELSVQELEDSITTGVLEKFYEDWYIKYGELKTFLDTHGNLNVPFVEDASHSLYIWMSSQRSQRKKGKLDDDRIKLLDEIGFEWETITQERIEELRTFKEQHRHFNVRRDSKENKGLRSWMESQRRRRDQGKINPEIEAALDEMGFEWEKPSTSSQERIEQLQVFKDQHGHFNVGYDSKEEPGLYKWTTSQRSRRIQGKIKPEVEAALNEMGFEWGKSIIQSPIRNQERIEQLRAFKEQHGHFNVRKRSKEDPGLNPWIARQRSRRDQGKINPEVEAALDQMGFEWEKSSINPFTRKRIEELRTFKEQYGHLDVSKRSKEEPGLNQWIAMQRWHRNQGKLNPEIEAALNEMGFVWEKSSINLITQERIEELRTFKEQYGHLDVRKRSKEKRRLYDWIVKQRSQRRKGKLNPEIEAALNEMGFEWGKSIIQSPIRSQERIEQLRAFKEQHGHFNVGRDSEEEQNMYDWIVLQRSKRNQGKLNPEIEAALDQMGFEWVKPSINLITQERIEELRTFKEQYGHLDVRKRSKAEPGLYDWTVKQRSKRRQGKINPEVEVALDQMGFEWVNSKTRRTQELIKALAAFKEQHGDFNVRRDFEEEPRLKQWIAKQTSKRNQGKLNPEIEAALNEIGFQWEKPLSMGFRSQERIEQLRVFKEQHGDFNVGRDSEEEQNMYDWIMLQRWKRRQGKINPEVEVALDEMGFEWEKKPTSPQEQIEREN